MHAASWSPVWISTNQNLGRKRRAALRARGNDPQKQQVTRIFECVGSVALLEVTDEDRSISPGAGHRRRPGRVLELDARQSV